MAVYTQVSAEALTAFLECYDRGRLISAKGIAEGVENSNYLVDTTQGRFILTLYEKRVAAADLPFFVALLAHLAERGLPVPRALPGRDGQVIRKLCNRPACLIEFLPGVSLTDPTPVQAHAAAAAMGRMHRALEDFAPARANTLGVETWTPLLERCGVALNGIADGLRESLARAIEHVESRWPHGAAHQVIHADLFADNVLMMDERVSGLIDFYFACTDLRLYDLAVMHSAWTFDAGGRCHDEPVGRALLDGYAMTRGLDKDERALLRVLAMGACIRFTLTRAWDWLNTPADAMVTRKDPLAYARRLQFYDREGAGVFR